MRRFVRRISREVVYCHHGGVAAGKVMLESQKLAAIAKRALSKQPYLRQTVENDPFGLNPINCIEDELDGLAKLKIGRIEQALLLVGIHNAFGWRQLENLNVGVECPAMGGSSSQQLILSLGQGDVESALSLRSAFNQKSQCERRFASPGVPSMRNRAPFVNPPERISSKPGTPVAAFAGARRLSIFAYLTCSRRLESATRPARSVSDNGNSGDWRGNWRRRPAPPYAGKSISTSLRRLRPNSVATLARPYMLFDLLSYLLNGTFRRPHWHWRACYRDAERVRFGWNNLQAPIHEDCGKHS